MMFVEITRLFIVLLATAAGFALGRGSGVEPGTGAVVGATLGALVGYVAGGFMGRLLRRAMTTVEEEVAKAPPAQLLVGTVGAASVGFIAGIVGFPAVMLLPSPWGWPVLSMLVWTGVYSGYMVAGRKSSELLALAGLSTRPLAVANRYGAPDDLILDTSAIIDGRLLGMARAGALRRGLLVPRFVLDELQTLADAQDTTRRRRGRAGLETLDALRRNPGTSVHVIDDELPEIVEVDAKLIALAKRLEAGIVTVDGALHRVAELEGVSSINLHRLADGLRPVWVPGELVTVALSREGKEPGQGVGFLEDGTMVVVTDAAGQVGQEVEVRITGSSQTSVGRMLFATLASVTES